MLYKLLKTIIYFTRLILTWFQKLFIYKILKLFRKFDVSILKVLSNCIELNILLITYYKFYLWFLFIKFENFYYFTIK